MAPSKRIGHAHRRKSCTTCGNGKRRCVVSGNGNACLRCIHLGIECKLPASVVPEPLSEAGSQPSTNSSQRSRTQPTISTAVYGEQMLSLWQPQATPLPTYPMTAMLNLNQTFSTMSSPPVPHSGFRLDPSICPSQFAQRMWYMMQAFSVAPRYMVQTHSTPWSHPRLYDSSMPRILQDAVAYCALHLSMNEKNAPFVTRAISSSLAEACGLTLDGSSNLLQHVAHVQALLLYLVIGLFDTHHPNILRDQARACSHRLEDAVAAMLAELHNEENLHRATDDDNFGACLNNLVNDANQSQKIWMRWIFHESARRTAIASLLLSRISKRLRGAMPSACEWDLYTDYSWTPNSSLWSAHSATEFMTVWCSNAKTPPMSVYSFLEMSTNMKAADMDIYAKMLLTGTLGFQEAKEWFEVRGAELEVL
jgi:hypothetical protein